MILSEMRCRNSAPADGGRALQSKRGNTDVAVYCFSDVDKCYAWSSYTRAMRLTSHHTYWSVVVEGVSCAKNIRGIYKRGAGTVQLVPVSDVFVMKQSIKEPKQSTAQQPQGVLLAAKRLPRM